MTLQVIIPFYVENVPYTQSQGENEIITIHMRIPSTAQIGYLSF